MLLNQNYSDLREFIFTRFIVESLKFHESLLHNNILNWKFIIQESFVTVFIASNNSISII